MIKVYYDLFSQPSRAVFIFMKLNKIPHVWKPVALADGEQFSESFKKLNPFCQVPVIQDGSFVLNETVSILKYLCTQHSQHVSKNWYPEDLKARAKVDAFTQWQHLTLRFGGANLFQALVTYPILKGKPVDQYRVKTATKALHQSLDKIELIYLKYTPFIYGQYVSIADLIAFCEIQQSLAIGVQVTKDRPKLTEWIKNVKDYIGQPLMDEAHQSINTIGKMFLKQQSTNNESKL